VAGDEVIADGGAVVEDVAAIGVRVRSPVAWSTWRCWDTALGVICEAAGDLDGRERLGQHVEQ
jgi:hypothetical protein